MVSFHLNQLKYALGLGGIMSFYGIVSMTVWLLGTKLGYPVQDRVVIIVLVLITLPFVLIVGLVVTVRNRRKKAKELAEAEAKDGEKVDGEQPAKAAVTPAGNYDDITKSTDEVVQFLKTSNLGEAGKDAVYSLPWYLVAGTPKSGKSSLVIGSNLNFQNLPSQRQSEQKFVRSTQAIDWRVTSDAVFVDTAGRYQGEGVDGDEWASLLETITKYRKTRPIDGFLLVANAEKILQSSDQEVEAMAKVLRTRLDDVMTRTKIRFPVYLIFTNADSIEGFRDSFSTSKGEGKNLVWGATIPIEKSDNAQALFDGEYEILHNSLMKRRLMRLSAPFPPVRQLRIFNFPLHFGSARRKIGGFVSTLFRPNPFSENPFLRGFYFTAAPANRAAAPAGGQTMSNMPQTIGTTYFTERLFRDVVLRDKDLVRTLQEQRQRPPILGWALTALGALLVLSLLTLAGVSLFNNKQMLDQATEKGVAVLDVVRNDNGKNPLTKTADEATREIKATEDLRQVMAQLDDYERNGAPFYMRMGFYSGDGVYENLLQIYLSVVEQRFKNPTVARVQSELNKFAKTPSNPNVSQLTPQEEENLGKNYELLRAYLMLSGEEEYRKRANATNISDALKDYWTTESKVPAELGGTAQQQLEFWAKQSDREKFPRIILDQNLVKITREKLKSFPAINRYYKRKIGEISKSVDEKFGPTSVEGLLTRNNADAGLVEGTRVVPGAYTLEGYKLMKAAIAESDKELSVDDWVMGEKGKANLAQITDASKLEEMYLRDYAQQWRDFVKGVNIKPYTKDNAKEALQSFSSVSSPIKILAQQIAVNTNFAAKPVSGSWWETIKGLWGSKPAANTGPTTEVEKAFLPLFGFLGEPGKPGQIDVYQSEIGRVANKFSGFSPGKIDQLSQDLANDNDKEFTELRNANTKIGSLLNPFNSTPTGQEVATLLKKPIENLNTLLGAAGEKQLEQTWKEQLLTQAKELEKGFPFEDAGADSDLPKLTAYLNPVNGTLSEFYDKRLKKFFDGNPGQLKLKENSPVKLSEEFVTYLNRMLLIREALYQKNANPSFEYEFKLSPIVGSLIEVTIDGQTITSEGTGTTKFKFPAGAGAETGVVLKISPTSGTISTSGTAPTTTTAPAANTSTTSNTNSVSKFLQTNSNSNSAASNPTLKESGNWGLFKFFYKGNPQKTGSQYSLTYSLGGKTVAAVVTPSGGDLFDKELFRSARAPEKFLK